MGWKALLVGDTPDLELLSTIFIDGDPKMSVDDQGNYFLESSTFDSAEAAESMEEAQRVLVRMNGAVMVQEPSYQAVRLSSRSQSEDGRHHAVVVAVAATGRTRATGAVVGTEGVPVDPPPPARSWLALAQTNPDVDDALRRLGSLDHDWLTLSNIVEVIMGDVGSIPKKGWSTADRLSLFTRSANHQLAAEIPPATPG